MNIDEAVMPDLWKDINTIYSVQAEKVPLTTILSRPRAA